ncbi:hypothetical protein GCM10009114_10260 [Aliiglaciecola litoralis]|uniref:Major Facilitator Superfamily protein n=1 Tax=Aliiglaciecola litoralis TaxID=582857 RepID=A0ABP3WP69_9ALTE
MILLIISSLTKLADLLVSPKTTLPYILTASGAPSWLISLLVPIKESGSLLPQWLLKTQVAHRFSNRTALWRLGALIQGIGIILLVVTIIAAQNNLLAIIVLILLMAIAGGRAICSLTMKDIQAETIQQGRRGKLIGLASSISGGLTLLSSIVFVASEQPLTQAISYGLLIVGGLLFLIALLCSLFLHVEYDPKAEEGDQQGFMQLVRSEPNLRHIIISRILLLHSALIVPFVVSSAATNNDSASSLAYFVGLSAFASLISSYVWGVFSDKGAVATLRFATVICIAAAVCVGMWIEQLPSYASLILFFILTLGHAGIRTGRKTYLLDITDRSNRTGYVAAANSCVGIGLLLLGAFYAYCYSQFGVTIVLFMAMLMAIGFVHSFLLEEVKESD